VINNRYPIIEKGNWMATRKLEYLPSQLMVRITSIHQSAAVHEYPVARTQLRALFHDLQKIVNERQKK
jgi:hypothetical protein